MSKTGSPNHAHSASKKIGFLLFIKIFLGLISPCTNAILDLCKLSAIEKS